MIEIHDPELLILRGEVDDDVFALLEECRGETAPDELTALGEATQQIIVEAARRSRNVIDMLGIDDEIQGRHRLLLTPSVCVRASAAPSRPSEIAPFPLPMLHGVLARMLQWAPRSTGTSLSPIVLDKPFAPVDTEDAAQAGRLLVAVRDLVPDVEDDLQVLGLRRRSLDTGRDEQSLLVGTNLGWRIAGTSSLQPAHPLAAWRHLVSPLGSARNR